PIGGRTDGLPWIHRRRDAPGPASAAGIGLEDGSRGIVVAGGSERSLGPEIPEFAARAGYPLLADPLSGAPTGPAARAPYHVLAAAAPAPAPAGWLEEWRDADGVAAGVLGDLFGDELTEPAVVWALGERLAPDVTLFVAASMPIRDIESFWPVRAAGPRVLSNRGANGIDGTVSSAFGAAASSPGPVVLLIGDVALAHDIR